MERPGAASLVARGKEVIVVGAGDAAQLVIREMLKAPALGYTPIGLIDDDPRKKNLRVDGVRVLGTTDDLPHVIRDKESAPPASITSASPAWIISAAAAIANAPEEQAVATAMLGRVLAGTSRVENGK